MKKSVLSIPFALLLASASIYATDVVSVTASGYDTNNGHKPENAIDGDTKTRWAVAEKDSWLELKLNAGTQVSSISLVPFRADERSLKFDIYSAAADKDWKPVATNINTSKSAATGETFTFTPVTADYIKLVVHGTDANNWSAIQEVEVNGSNSFPSTAVQ